MTRSWRCGTGQQGAVLLVAVVILVVLLFLGASLIERAQNCVASAATDGLHARAFHLAEAGLQKAVWGFNQPNGWFGYQGEGKTLLGGGYFQVSVSPPPSQRGMFTDQLVVLSTGSMPGPDGTARLPVRIRAVVRKEPKYFAYAVFGNDKVTIGNGTVTVKADSYDSKNGGYGGGNILENADVGTNSTAANAIEILPKGEVHGGLTVGSGATDPNACVNNKGLITGTTSAALSSNYLPGVTSVPAGAIQLGDVYLENDQQLVLEEGTYHMTDLEILGNAKITCNGKVVIYIDQSADRDTPDVRIGGNGIVNTSGIPSNLVLLCAPDVVSIAISGNGTFYGGIYAPQAQIALNSGVVYGSLVGKTVALNGATSHVHYDESLRDQTNPKVQLASWQQL